MLQTLNLVAVAGPRIHSAGGWRILCSLITATRSVAGVPCRTSSSPPPSARLCLLGGQSGSSGARGRWQKLPHQPLVFKVFDPCECASVYASSRRFLRGCLLAEAFPAIPCMFYFVSLQSRLGAHRDCSVSC